MAAELILGGRYVWGGQRDNEYHRTYMIAHRVRTTDLSDGPYVVMQCPGLPTPNTTWNFGNDNDIRAFCYPEMKVDLFQQKPGFPHRHWLVTQKFSTKSINTCQSTAVEDPLLEPMKVSGSFLKYTKEVSLDRFGAFIKTSSHERIKGPPVEFDANRHQVNVSQNVASLELDLLTQMMDSVNDAPLWGMSARKVKLSEASWEKKYQGSCSVYFTRNMGFDIDDRGFDRDLWDEGANALHGEMLNGEWVVTNIPPLGYTGTGTGGTPPDRNNPSHFVRIQDAKGNVMRMLLNGYGVPVSSGDVTGTGTGIITNPGQIRVEYYSERNMLLLAIPEDLET